eukprot:GHVQ01033343.1.p1 GENE.GHVQ01033343.1~~GHVQ01033343.1.p1  ORF type:complete len:494 (+),score=91.81 GHVQ01033343.1:141-1622(+)
MSRPHPPHPGFAVSSQKSSENVGTPVSSSSSSVCGTCSSSSSSFTCPQPFVKKFDYPQKVTITANRSLEVQPSVLNNFGTSCSNTAQPDQDTRDKITTLSYPPTDTHTKQTRTQTGTVSSTTTSSSIVTSPSLSPPNTLLSSAPSFSHIWRYFRNGSFVTVLPPSPVDIPSLSETEAHRLNCRNRYNSSLRYAWTQSRYDVGLLVCIPECVKARNVRFNLIDGTRMDLFVTVPASGSAESMGEGSCDGGKEGSGAVELRMEGEFPFEVDEDEDTWNWEVVSLNFTHMDLMESYRVCVQHLRRDMAQSGSVGGERCDGRGISSVEEVRGSSSSSVERGDSKRYFLFTCKKKRKIQDVFVWWSCFLKGHPSIDPMTDIQDRSTDKTPSTGKPIVATTSSKDARQDADTIDNATDTQTDIARIATEGARKEKVGSDGSRTGGDNANKTKFEEAWQEAHKLFAEKIKRQKQPPEDIPEELLKECGQGDVVCISRRDN